MGEKCRGYSLQPAGAKAMGAHEVATYGVQEAGTWL